MKTGLKLDFIIYMSRKRLFSSWLDTGEAFLWIKRYRESTAVWGGTAGASTLYPIPSSGHRLVLSPLSVRPPPERKLHLPAPSSRPPLSSSPRRSAAVSSVPVAFLGVGASCVTIKSAESLFSTGEQMDPSFDY
ncbi:hypothetical protein ILYODFUR_019384 [Ilyodon furcidens]|uniref:Uncharacterized protein n=1 Tax=Ilyodon furcidens TaxID=33524 RepID=A0ABV0TK42_9TELE